LPTPNKNPEQLSRDQIDQQSFTNGWLIQYFKQKNIAVALGVVIREYPTDTGPADWILIVNKKPVGVIEAKREEEGVHFTMHENQLCEYAAPKLKYIINNNSLPLVFESTSELTRFTDYGDPKPHSRPVSTFHRPETFEKWLRENAALRAKLFEIFVLQTKGLRDC
jgi:type I restriction enzyme R subunit